MILFSSSRASVARHLLIHLCTKMEMKVRVGVRATESGDKEGGRNRRRIEGRKDFKKHTSSKSEISHCFFTASSRNSCVRTQGQILWMF